ncbi:hypothetical protein [Streptacidiphilus sp. PAMC 29251]
MRLAAPIGLFAGAWYPPDRQTVQEALAVGDVDARTARATSATPPCR